MPCAADGLAGFTILGDRTLEQRGIDRIYDLAEADLGRLAGEEVSSGLAATTFDEACSAQVVEDLDQEISGYRFPLREIFETCKSPPVMGLRKLG